MTDLNKRSQVRVHLGQLWVSSIGGTLLVMLLQSIAADSDNWTGSWSPDWMFMLDRAIRYGFIVWYTCFAFVAYVVNELSTDGSSRRLFYDVIQSCAILFPVWPIGFWDQSFPRDITYNGSQFSVAFLGIVVIGGLAFFFFYSRNDQDKRKLQWSRACIAITATAGGGVAAYAGEPSVATWASAVCLILCFVSLFAYWRVRFRPLLQEQAVAKEPSKPLTADKQSRNAAAAVAVPLADGLTAQHANQKLPEAIVTPEVAPKTDPEPSKRVASAEGSANDPDKI